MKILLVYPQPQTTDHSLSMKIQKTFFTNAISSFQALRNVTPIEHSLDILDERFDNIDFEDDADLIGISAMTYQAPRAYSIADEFRKRGKQVVIGGWHPSALPQEARPHATALVVGE